MLLQHATWPDIESYLARGHTIVVPIGSTEQHGPTGLIGTDAICAESIAEAVGGQLDLLVAPTINVGMAQHHMGFPGTITLRPTTLIQLILDYLLSLSETGFRNFYFINGHGGNEATVTAAFSEFHLHAARYLDTEISRRCRLVNWWQHPPVKALARNLFGSDEGAHATPSEVAVTQYRYPETARSEPLSKRTGEPCLIHDRFDFRRRYPDGRVGSDPSLASPELGRQIFDCAVEAIATDLREFLQAS